ncbi:unnamed protein product [Larinioides sclopetarius]|uniref:Scavenger receptor class B member 1 n=1 Tax=Larinioides sclopetarius TaxID=280406 RepID=A0AAV1YPZ9_9ARAC
MAAKCMSRKAAKIVLWVAAAILVVSVTILLIFPTVYKNQLKSDVTLTDGSLLTGIWRDIPLPLYEKLYFFNITNGDDFLNNKAPLNVTEMGPYTYSARWVKRYPEWHSNGTVSYRETRTYHFEPQLSVGSQEDVITTLNGPLIIAAEILKQYSPFERTLASLALGIAGEHVIIQKTVKELAYEGYPDTIMKLARFVVPNSPYQDGRFSWLYGKNATNDGVFTVFTGETDPKLTNIINKWNGQDKVTFWKNDTCNTIKGTSIETGPPLPDVPESYTFFQSIFCRSLTFNYTGDVNHYGVVTKRFKPTQNVFANGTEYPDNSCFDVKARPSGVSDIKNCQFGAPALISWPHFYMADPSYLKDINGLQPNEEDHSSHLDADPITGISLDIQVRFQINLEMSRVPGLLQFSNVPEGIFPVFWAGLEIHVTDDWAHFLKGQLNNPKIIAYSVLGGLVLICLVLIIISLIVLRKTADDDEDDPLIDVKEEHKQNLSKKVIVPNYNSSDSYKEGTSGINQRRAMKESEASQSGSINSSFPTGAYEEDDVTVIPVDPSIDKKS